MGLGYKTKNSTGTVPVWQRNGLGPRAFQGGFLLVIAGLMAGAYLPAGTPMAVDETARTAVPLVTARAQAAADATAVNYPVLKGHHFEVGDYLAARTKNKAYPITAIDTSNADYDVITVGTTIGAVAEGDLLFSSTTTGATNSSFGAVNGLLYEDTLIEEGQSVTVIYEGEIYARRVPYSVDLDAQLPRILYSQSL